jgi:hypothetical protein
MVATAVGSYATATALKQMVGITDSTDDTLLGLICDRVNQYIESTCKQAIAPITSATYTYDGHGLRRIFLPMPISVTVASPPAGSTLAGIGGMRAVTVVQLAPYTAGTFETLTATDYSLRGRFGVSGPYRWLLLTDKPAGSYSTYREGLSTVKVTGTAGWAAIPDDIIETALSIAARAWNARQMQEVVGTDEQGIPVVANYVSGRDRETLRRYTLRPPV